MGDRAGKILNEALGEDYEWWLGSSRDAFYEAADYLTQKGISDHKVVELLSSLHAATAAEYGD